MSYAYHSSFVFLSPQDHINLVGGMILQNYREISCVFTSNLENKMLMDWLPLGGGRGGEKALRGSHPALTLTHLLIGTDTSTALPPHF